MVVVLLAVPLCAALVAAGSGTAAGDRDPLDQPGGNRGHPCPVGLPGSAVRGAALTEEEPKLSTSKKATFRPEFVAGDPGDRDPAGNWIPAHRTTWNLVSFGDAAPDATPFKPAAIQFFVGLDGLNVWLVVLTALLMVSGVLVSWTSITERVNEYYAWLLVLETGMLGVFLAFDIILFYVFFELTLVPLFFLIGIWGGPQRRYAARKFFIFTLTGSVITLLGLLGGRPGVLFAWTTS